MRSSFPHNRNNSQIVTYDMQVGVFRKINKQTGQSVEAYRNGATKSCFKPNVTGMNYHLRRAKLIDFPKPVLSFRTHQVPSQKMTVSHSESKPFYPHNMSQKPIAYPEKCKKPVICTQSTINKLRQLQTSQTVFITDNKDHDQTLNKLQAKMKDYETLCQQKLCENHSPFRDVIPGNTHRPQSKSMNTTVKDHATIEQTYFNQEKKLQKKLIKDRKPVDLKFIRRITASQKRLFYQFHPQLVPKEDETSIAQQRDRKINLRTLQKAFIKKADSQTQHVYGS